MLFIIILSILTILIFIPIPIKIKVNYKDKNFKFYIYNTDVTNKIINSEKIFYKNVDKKEDQIPKSKNTLKIFLDCMKDIKYKPSLKIKFQAIYGLDNAAYTAFLHGLVTSFYPMLIQLINMFFYVRESDIKVHPEFNRFVLSLEVNSIIFVNLAKIIYMSFIILRSLHKSKKINLANT